MAFLVRRKQRNRSLARLLTFAPVAESRTCWSRAEKLVTELLGCFIRPPISSFSGEGSFAWEQVLRSQKVGQRARGKAGEDQQKKRFARRALFFRSDCGERHTSPQASPGRDAVQSLTFGPVCRTKPMRWARRIVFRQAAQIYILTR
jgi:hypothetical protein